MADRMPADQGPIQLIAAVQFSDRERPPPCLPVQPTSFVGREHEVAAIGALLRRPNVRLLTMAGPGGVGKTRLALRVAQDLAADFVDGVVFVDLTPVTGPDLVVPTVATALGVRDTGDRPVSARLADALRDRALLLVLDNFEHVVAAAPVVASLLGDCPRLAVLVTSREVLRLAAEWVVAVPPLAVPGRTHSVERLDENEAVRLFVARAEAARSDFALTEANAPAVAELTRRLDGLPLAIELAATRVAHLPPAALLARMDHLLPLLTRGVRDAPARQQTMVATIAWSHDLLAPTEQTLFRRLAVFVGGCTLEAAESAVGAMGTPGVDVLDGIAALVAKSLLLAEEGPGGEPRYRMLETLREFGLRLLAEAGEESAIRDASAGYFVLLAERTVPLIDGPDEGLWLARLERERGNLRAALAWLERTGDTARLLRLAAALGEFWELSMHLAEGDAWLERALAAELTPSPVRLVGLLQCGTIAHYRGHHARGTARLEEAAILARRLGSNRLGLVLMYAGTAAADRGSYEEAEALQAEALEIARVVGDRYVEAFARAHLGIVAWGRGDPDLATAHLEAARAIGLAEGYPLPVETADRYLAHIACDAGEYARAAEHFHAIVTEHRNSAQLPRSIPGVAMLARCCGQPERAVRLFGATEARGEATGLAPALPERATYEQAIADLHRALDDSDFRAAWEAGRALSTDRVLAEIEAVLDAVVGSESRRHLQHREKELGLTVREREVLQLLVGGKSNPEIGEALFISPRTAQAHLTNVFAKLGVASRAEAAAVAARDGLV